jgi:integrase
MRLLVETDIETGLRWGELTELRPKDIDFAGNTLLVSRVVVHLKSADQVGPRFRVKEYPKDREWRRVAIAEHLADKLRTHIARRRLGADDLLFPLLQVAGPTQRRRPFADPSTLGLTEPDERGLTYRHGTMTAYQAGKCPCQYCRDALADYRARRRADGKDNPRRPRVTQTDADRHMSNDWFRHNVWNPALAAADLGFRVTPHGLRHAHASWLLAGGADVQVVKERLGHGSITTTEKYLHALPDAGQAALAALDKMRPSPDRAWRGPLSGGGAALDLTEALQSVDGQTARLLLAGLLAKAQDS